MARIKFSMIVRERWKGVLWALEDPVNIFSEIADVFSVKKFPDLGIFELRIRFRRLLTTVIDTVYFTVNRGESSVVYESIEPGKMRAAFEMRSQLGSWVLDVSVEYREPPGVSGIEPAVERIFKSAVRRAEFAAPMVERARVQEPEPEGGRQLVQTYGMKGEEASERPVAGGVPAPVAEPPMTATSKSAETPPGPSGEASLAKISCTSCLLYEPGTSLCAYLMARVPNPEDPLCKGEKYIRAS